MVLLAKITYDVREQAKRMGRMAKTNPVAAGPDGEIYEGIRSEPRKKEIRQPNQEMAGLKVREEFQESGDESDEMEYKSDISYDEDDIGSGEEGEVEEAGDGDGEESGEEPDFEDLM